MRGHLRERGKGTWELRVYLGRDPITRRDRYKTKTFKGGKRGAQEALAGFVAQTGAGTSSEGTFGALVERWFTVASVSKDWSPKTIVETRRIIDTKLGPLLPVPLDKLRTSALDSFYADLRARGGRCGHAPRRDHGAQFCEKGASLSAASVRRIHVVVHAALEQGIAWDWLLFNSATKASPGKVEHPDVVPAEVPQVLDLIDAAERDNPDLAVFLILAAVTGARRGELCALRWSDIDAKGATVTFSRVISLGPEGPVERRKPKTRSSLRTISLDTASLAVLSAHRSRCMERALTLGESFSANAYLFSREADGSQPWRPDSTSRKFRQLRDSIGLDREIHLHSLRHFVVTTLLGAGVALPQVAGRVGHGGGGHTTLSVYSHFQQAPDRDAADLLARILQRPNRQLTETTITDEAGS
ncbi:MAG TPA: site-specific integrase [Acidimicrobiales bacterium]|nr:site-specific integrase [Acidimicrobiales bacterium]